MQTGSSANVERTSSVVNASAVIPFSRTASRRPTRSSQPHRRSRPVTVPYSPPSSRTRSWSGPSISVGNGPSPTRVTYAFATPITRSMRFGPIPIPVAAAAAIGLEEDGFDLAEGSVDQQGRVRDIRPEPLRVALGTLDDLLEVEGRRSVDALEPDVLLGERDFDLLAKDLRIEEVLDADAEPCGLVRVGRADPAAGGADLELA